MCLIQIEMQVNSKHREDSQLNRDSLWVTLNKAQHMKREKLTGKVNCIWFIEQKQTDYMNFFSVMKQT